MKQEFDTEQGMAQRMWRRLRNIMWEMPYDPLEIAFAIPVLFMSLALLNPWADTFATAASYRAMEAIAPEWLWGLFGGIPAAFMIWATLMEQARCRVLCALGLTAYLSLTGLLIGLANPLGTGLWTYLGFAFFAGIVTIRAGRDVV